MKRIVYHRLAISELFRQSAYFERRRPGYGSLFIAEIEMAVALASHQPLLGAAEVLGCRSWRVNRFPFLAWRIRFSQIASGSWPCET